MKVLKKLNCKKESGRVSELDGVVAVGFAAGKERVVAVWHHSAANISLSSDERICISYTEEGSNRKNYK